ncbi:MAG: DUF2974 domain-containing protein [Olsenella sp.]|nr:DUF2974 domain-containing protein [Olsenella sp.]
MAQMPRYPVDRGNIIEYVETQLDSLATRPFCDVDSLVLSWLSYCAFPDSCRTRRGAGLAELYDRGQLGEVTAVMCDRAAFRHMLSALVASPRFRGLRVCSYVEETDPATDKQFSAVTFRLPEHVTYVAFRGTDGSLVGWREDFNIALETELPSQRSAVEYVGRVAGAYRGQLWLGGHSKGGNLAVYAAMMCPERIARRIVAAYSHDGPGFPASFIDSPTWRDRSGLVRKTIPHQSVIGMIFELQDDYRVVRATSDGIMQHDPFSWVVDGQDFSYARELSLGARHLDASIKSWVTSVSHDDRALFVDTLFDVLGASGKQAFHEIGEDWQAALPAMLERMGQIPPDQREVLGKIVWAFVQELASDQGQRPFDGTLQPLQAKLAEWFGTSPKGA